MQKIHLQTTAKVQPGFEQEALAAWQRESLMPRVVRACDQRMMLKSNADFLTTQISKVTCQKCLRHIEKSN